MNQLSIAFLLLTSTISFAQQTTDIRQVRWGFSSKQVKEAETVKPTSVKRDKLVYARVPLINRTVGLEYTFNADSLLSASYYYFTTASVTEADVKAAAHELETLLQEKYGKGKTLQLGDTQNVVWLTPRTQITLTLGNVDKGWSVELAYLCRVYPGAQIPNIQVKDNGRPLKEIKNL
ncbi:hypothetical protein [Spirosoma sp.]|uniref:hypothetical protein n=1 Tax=Spirosoma sp. TaxID=1899569 RepID=UPI003B3BB687